MNLPHVAELHYAMRMEHPRARIADDAVCEDVELGPFRCTITHEHRLIAVPQEHFATEGEARAVLEPCLRAWESHADLTADFRLRFTFQSTTIVDQDPLPDQLAPTGKPLKLRWNPQGPTLIVHAWPPVPPAALRETDDVCWMRMRWLAALDGKEDLLATANRVLSWLEQAYGQGAREQAAASLFVDRSVLDQVSELSVAGAAGPLASDEIAWLREAVPRLILRAAEVESLPHPLPTLSADRLEGGSLWAGPTT
jgi:hypothetical protein